MSRSSKKGPYVDERLMKKISQLSAKGGPAGGGKLPVIKTWARSSVVAPEMVGFTLGIHNGKTHVEVLIKEEMVGHRLGEFALTRKFIKHGGRMQKQLEADAAAAEAAKKAAATSSPAAKK